MININLEALTEATTDINNEKRLANLSKIPPVPCLL